MRPKKPGGAWPRKRPGETVGSADRRAQSRALLAGARAVLEEHDFELAARSIFQACKVLLGAASGYVALLSEDGSENEVVYLDPGGLGCSVDPELPMPIRGLRGEVYRTGEARCHNLFSRSRWTRFLPAGHVALENVLFAPMVLEGRTVGLVGLANKPGGFTRDDLRLAEAFAGLAAVSLGRCASRNARRVSEEKFRKLFEQSPIGKELFDARGRLVEVNRACLDIFGVKDPDEVKEFSLFDDPNLDAATVRSLRKGREVTREISFDFGKVRERRLYRTRKRGIHHLRVSITPITGTGKAGLEGFLVQVQDLTDRRRMEDALRKMKRELKRRIRERTAQVARAAELLETVFSSIDILIAYLDADLNFIRVNRAYADSVGHTTQSLVGRNCFELFPSPETEAIFREVVRTGKPYYAFSKKSGYRHPERGDTYWDWSLLPLKGEGRGVSGLILSLIEVTARVKAEEKAHIEQALRHAVEDCLVIGIVAVDREGRHTYANPAFCDMTGLTDEQLRGSLPPFAYWPPEERTAIEASFRRVLSGDCPPAGIEVRFMRRNGERFDAHLLASPLIGIEGNLEGWVASVGDVTKRKQDEAAIRESAKQLRQLSYELLTAGEKERKRVSHELHDSIGQTMSAVKYGIEKAVGQLQAGIPRQTIDHLLRQTITLVQGAVEEVRSITSDLRPAILDDLGIIAAVRWHCREFERMHQGIRIRRSVELAEKDVPAHLKIVMYRIVQEALNNVAKHSGADSVKVSLRLRDGALELALADNGRGFDPDTADRGLGLTSMRERAELSGGQLTIEAGKRGKGTVLRVAWKPLEISL